MIDALKNIAARQVGRVLASDATMKVISNPQVQSAMMRAINFRAEARDVVESRLHGVASALDLVTADDVATLKRKIRDLEDEVTDLRDELDETAERAKAADVRSKSTVATAAAAKTKAPAAKTGKRKTTRRKTVPKKAASKRKPAVS